MAANEQDLMKKIDKGERVDISFFQSESETNSLIKKTIDKVCARYRQDYLSDIIYGCVKELVINATKANLKRAFFQKNGLNIHNMGQYVTGLVKFKAMLEHHEYLNYLEQLKQMDLWVKFVIRHDPNGIIFEVVNNTAISEVEEGRIRMKLKKAMNYDDIVLFYNTEQDESEGAGMGIALIVILMKKASLDPQLFRIGSKSDTTWARIEIPLTEKYKAIRHKLFLL